MEYDIRTVQELLGLKDVKTTLKRRAPYLFQDMGPFSFSFLLYP